MHVGILSGEFENYSLIFESVYKGTTSTNKSIIGIYNKSSRLNQAIHKQFIYSGYGEKNYLLLRNILKISAIYIWIKF